MRNLAAVLLACVCLVLTGCAGTTHVRYQPDGVTKASETRVPYLQEFIMQEGENMIAVRPGAKTVDAIQSCTVTLGREVIEKSPELFGRTMEKLADKMPAPDPDAAKTTRPESVRPP